MKRPTLFLDRDGTVLVYKPYLGHPDDVELIEGVSEALGRAKQLGWRLFLFSNQSGVARGYYTLEKAHACNARMVELLGLGDDVFDEMFIADEMPSDSPVYRKPSPRFILETIRDRSLDREACWMVGDNESDIETALRAGVHAVAVGTGLLDEESVREQFPTAAVAFYPDLLSFVRALADQGNSTT